MYGIDIPNKPSVEINKYKHAASGVESKNNLLLSISNKTVIIGA